MSAPQPTDASDIREVASLLIPINGQTLLVPNVSVAEIVPLGQIDEVPDAPEWYLGDYHWRDLTIPLVSFEVLSGGDRTEIGNSVRVVVFNTTGVSEHIHFVALMAQGIPRLVRVTPDELQVRNEAAGPFERMPVRWAGESALIPDIPEVEQRVLDYLKTRVE